MMAVTVDVLLLLVAVPLVLAAAYLAGLAAIALMPGGRKEPFGASARNRRFVFILPAHNEERAIADAISSLRSIDYSADLVRIVVVADNCDDETAAIARAAGAEVIDRTSAERGKGFALAAGLAHVADSFDGVVFMDADCVISPNALRVFDEMLARGDNVVQAQYLMRARGNASHAALREMSLALVHLVRPLARERVGASAGLKGSGMCFSRQAIEQAGWQSTGLAEDAEQHVRLLQAGMRVAFARDVIVTGEQPASLGDARKQHQRWEAGRASVAGSSALPLLAAGIRTRSLPMLDAAIDLMIPPVSIVLLGLAGVGAVAFVLDSGAAWLALAGVLMLVLYFAAGAVLSSPRPGDLARAIASVPAYAGWKAWVYAQSLIARPDAWERTRRDS
jgi:cellulose synthase/poly-beta-1,6-N-acetylglucosamine synthase-like glycosyltransferase